MVKTELIAYLAGRTKSTQAVAKLHLEAVIAKIKYELRKGHEVRLAGFGVFSGVMKSARPARKVRNPRNGEMIDAAATPAKHVAKFKPASTLMG